MTLPFAMLAVLTIAGAVGALSLRNLVHCALCLVVSFVGLAGIYFELGAPFVGLIQILVYAGAVAILVVFALLLTRGGGAETGPLVSPSWLVGLGVAFLVFGTLALVIAGAGPAGRRAAAAAAEPGVREIGERLMTDAVLPLEVVGLLLTAALIGAVLIAREDRVDRH